MGAFLPIDFAVSFWFGGGDQDSFGESLVYTIQLLAKSSREGGIRQSIQAPTTTNIWKKQKD